MSEPFRPHSKHKSGCSKRSASEGRKRTESAKKCSKIETFFTIAGSTASVPNQFAEVTRLPRPATASDRLDSSEQSSDDDDIEIKPTGTEVPDLEDNDGDLTNAEQSQQFTESECALCALNDIGGYMTNNSDSESVSKLLKPSTIQKIDIIKMGACQPRSPFVKFPKTETSCRSFSDTYYNFTNHLGENRPRWWLSYSPTLDAAYCHSCWLFCDGQPNLWKDWRHLSTRVTEHSKLKTHLNASEALLTFQKNHSIDVALKKAIEDDKQRWRYILMIQMDVLRTLSALNLPLRGSSLKMTDSNCGVYLTIMKLLASYVPQLQHHLSSANRIQYMSNTMMEEQVMTLAKISRKRVLQEIEKAVFWTVIIDGTTDISKTDQVALLIRYVKMNYPERLVEIKESFITFFNLSDHSAQGYVQGLLGSFNEYHLNTIHLVGQAYDGASVMSGAEGGVQAILRKKVSTADRNAFVPYVHCPPHQLNLVLHHAAERNASIPVMTFFGTVQLFYTFFADSPQRRWALLKERSKALSRQSSLSESKAALFDDILFDDLAEKLHEDEPSCDAADELATSPGIAKRRTVTLKNISATRWSARASATSALIENLPSVVDSLQTLVDERHDTHEVTTAYNLLTSITFQFVVTLVFWNKLLQIVNITSQMLQKKESDLFQVVEYMDRATAEILEYRNDAAVQKVIHDAHELWNDCDMDPDSAKFLSTRIRRKKKMPGEVACDKPIEDAEQKFHVEVIYATVDSMVNELRQRTDGIREVTQLFGFLSPRSLRDMSTNELQKQAWTLVGRFPSYLNGTFPEELVQFRAAYFSSSNPCFSRGAMGLLEFITIEQLGKTTMTVLFKCYLECRFEVRCDD